MNWHIGCSGFHYSAWKGIFYPQGLPQKNWFNYYCTQFDTLELNVTFYRFPQLSFLENWYNKSPEEFRFSVKAPRAITHYSKFKETEEMLSDFYSTIKLGLKEKLGCVLFQLPPGMTFSAERLQQIIRSLDLSFSNIIEFRHPSWWKQEVYDELAKFNISISGISHPSLPKDIIINTPVVYYRFHGVPVLYDSEYSVEELEQLVSAIKANNQVVDVYVYFNNTMNESAIKNATKLKGMVMNSSS